MINKDDLTSLSYEKKVKYRAAIECGFFDNYEKSPSKWWHSLVGKFLHKWPRSNATLRRLRDIVGHTPTWEDMTDDTLEDLMYACQDEGMTASSIRTYTAELKSVLNANKSKVPSQNFNDILKITAEKSQAVYLTREEIQRIIDYTPNNASEQYVRRNFIVSCLTGARLSDAVRLTIDNCNIDTGILSYVPEKTSKIIVNVPVDEGMNLRGFLAEECRKKSDSHMFNIILRRICKSCHIDEMKTLRRKEQVVTGPKYEFVSAHTARRSFATNLYLAGVALEDVALLMGHGKNIETTKNYICAERQISSNVMAYFQPQQAE